MDLSLFHGDLLACLFYTEPAARSVDGELYLALHCADGDMPHNGRIVLLGFRDGVWNYRGTLLDNRRDSRSLGGEADFQGFSAPELVHLPQIGRTYLIVTPTTPRKQPAYRGCFVLQINDIARALLLRNNQTPRLIQVSNGDPDLHNGACAYLDSLGGGLIQGQVYPDQIDTFRLYRTGLHL
jgi:hypothetical protein